MSKKQQLQLQKQLIRQAQQRNAQQNLQQPQNRNQQSKKQPPQKQQQQRSVSLTRQNVPVSLSVTTDAASDVALKPYSPPGMAPEKKRLRIVVTGGFVANPKKMPLITVHIYTPLANLWQEAKPMNKPRSQHCAVMLKNSANKNAPQSGAVLLGGFASSMGSVERSSYSEASGIHGWQEDIPAMQMGRFAHGAAILDGNIIVAGGQRSKTEILSSVELFSPQANQWAFRTPMLVPRASFGMVAMDGALYVVGGVSGPENVPLATGEKYIPQRNTCTPIAPMIMPRKSPALVDVSKNHGNGSHGLLYVIGGYSFGHARREVECYDQATNSWQRKASLPVGVMDASVARVGKYIWLIGGFDGSEITTRVWRYDTQADVWCDAAPLPQPKSLTAAVVV